MNFLKNHPFIAIILGLTVGGGFISLVPLLGGATELHSFLTVKSPLTQQQLFKKIADPQNWKTFMPGLSRVEVSPLTELKAGSSLRLSFLPPQKPWKRFELFLTVKEWSPPRHLIFLLAGDSKQKIEKSMRNVVWELDIMDNAVRRTVNATPISYRAHWFTRFFPRVVANQLFYFDLLALTENEVTKTAVPSPFNEI